MGCGCAAGGGGGGCEWQPSQQRLLELMALTDDVATGEARLAFNSKTRACIRALERGCGELRRHGG